MNRIEFQVQKKKRERVSGGFTLLVNILVDGRPLAELMAAYEMPMAKKEGHPGLAGDYHALEVFPPLDEYYLGNDGADCGEEGNKTVLLGCSCGISACWPLLCLISIQGDKVIWSDFEQPHRDEDWDYSAFAGFVFEKRQYLEAIDAMKDA